MSTQPTGKTFRCESCGAALSVDKPTCDYCGSSHQIPAMKPEAFASQTSTVQPILSLRRLAVLLAVAATSAIAAWLILR